MSVIFFSALSTLTLLVGWQEGHPACKNSVISRTQNFPRKILPYFVAEFR